MANVVACVLVAVLIALPAGPAAAAAKAVDGVVNLNTAPPATLLLLPGIGPAKVDRIVAYRRRRPFRTVDELVRVKGIGRKMVRALRSHLAVNGPTTATPATPSTTAIARAASVLAAPPPPPPRAPPRPDPRAARAPVRARPSVYFPLARRGYCLRPP